jgi:hypothetical protein
MGWGRLMGEEAVFAKNLVLIFFSSNHRNKKPNAWFQEGHRAVRFHPLPSATRPSLAAGPVAFRPPISRSLALSVYIFIGRLKHGLNPQGAAYWRQVKNHRAGRGRRLEKMTALYPVDSTGREGIGIEGLPADKGEEIEPKTLGDQGIKKAAKHVGGLAPGFALGIQTFLK